MLPDELKHFLAAYLAVEGSPRTAARSFVRTESPDAVRDVIAAIRRVLDSSPPPATLRRELQRDGNVVLPQSVVPRDFLLNTFAALSAEAGLSRAVKAYDVFVSYASSDAALATWLATELKNRGYSVWMDKDEILVGHNILDSVYRGITESEFLVVLLTKKSVRSKWVREELTAARLKEIENSRVTVLPVKCETDVDVPDVLHGKRWADMSASREEGLTALIRAIDLHRVRSDAGPDIGAQARHNSLSEWYAELQHESVQYGYDPQKGGYKDFVVGPPDDENLRYDKRQLLTLLDNTRVRIRGWGGAPFPYEASKAAVADVPDGLRLVDTHRWPYSEWSFHYWRISDTLRFFQRSGLSEDGDLAENNDVALRDCLNVVWVLKDVCMALMFAANLLREVPTAERFVVVHRLGGMNGRRLFSRRLSQWPSQRDRQFVAAQDVIEQVAILSRGSDLKHEATRVVQEMFWLFNWRDAPESLIERDIQSFLSGRFPVPGW